MTDNYKIYGLKKMGSDEVRYIGFTGQSLSKRLQGHILDKHKSYKRNWLISLKLNKCIPEIEIIEDGLTFNEALTKEQRYIKLFKSFGANLVNLTNGGEGINGYKHTLEQKNKWSKDRRGVKSNWILSEESKMKISNKLKGKKHSVERIKNILEGKKNGKKPKSQKGKILSQETKDKIRAIMKEKWKDPEYRNSMVSKHKQSWLNGNYINRKK